MKRVFVDSNVLLRYFVNDADAQHRAVRRLFRECDAGKVVLVIGPPALFEVAWTLKAAYSQSRETILDILASILSTSGVEVADADTVQEAISLARKHGQDFADAYVTALAADKHCHAIATFNKKHFAQSGVDLYPL